MRKDILGPDQSTRTGLTDESITTLAQAITGENPDSYENEGKNFSKLLKNRSVTLLQRVRTTLQLQK